MNYKRNYIGKGTQVADMDIVKVTIPVEKIAGLTHKWEGAEYLTFEIAKMKTPDEYGRTHTCYVSTREEAPVKETPAPKAKAKKTKKEEPEMQEADQDRPF